MNQDQDQDLEKMLKIHGELKELLRLKSENMTRLRALSVRYNAAANSTNYAGLSDIRDPETQQNMMQLRLQHKNVCREEGDKYRELETVISNLKFDAMEINNEFQRIAYQDS